MKTIKIAKLKRLFKKQINDLEDNKYNLSQGVYSSAEANVQQAYGLKQMWKLILETVESPVREKRIR